MPPKVKKPKAKKDDDDEIDDLEISDEEEEVQEVDSDYDQKKKADDEDESDDDEGDDVVMPKKKKDDEVGSDDEGDSLVEYPNFGEEDDIEPPTHEVIKRIKVVKPEDRVTSERMSIKECARFLGDRARHLENGAKPNIDITNYTSSLEIAYAELMQKKLPMCTVRSVGNVVEIWRAKEMIIPKLPPIEKFMVHIL